MPPIPSACQALADQVSTLEQRYTALAAQTAAEFGAPAWAGLAQLGTLRLQLSDAVAALDECTRIHTAALTGTVVVIEASGGSSANGAQTATLWDLTGSGPIASAQVQVQAGAFGFQGPLPAQAAITIRTGGASDTEITGVDFRSGPLPGPLAAQTPRIEMVVGPKLLLPISRLQAWASSFESISQKLALPELQLEVEATVSSITVAPVAGSLSVAVAGLRTRTIAGGGVAGPATLVDPKVMLLLQPSASPQGDAMVSVTSSGQPEALRTGSLDALVISLETSIQALFLGFAQDLIERAFSDWIHRVLPGFVAEALALPALPEGTAVSLRSLTIDEQGIHLQPVLSAFGTALSTFRPAPLPVPRATD